MEFRSCARGVSGVASFVTTDEQIKKKPRLLFSRAGYDSWGLSISSDFYYYSKPELFFRLLAKIAI